MLCVGLKLVLCIFDGVSDMKCIVVLCVGKLVMLVEFYGMGECCMLFIVMFVGVSVSVSSCLLWVGIYVCVLVMLMFDLCIDVGR